MEFYCIPYRYLKSFPAGKFRFCRQCELTGHLVTHYSSNLVCDIRLVSQILVIRV